MPLVNTLLDTLLPHFEHDSFHWRVVRLKATARRGGEGFLAVGLFGP